MFDSFRPERARLTGQPFVPFDPVRDDHEYVDGKPRAGQAEALKTHRADIVVADLAELLDHS